ncbi:hypothetical protein [Rhodospirillum centenum]|uniref:Uncharacterized protein n=1 Tax=Rhodospirillum centenum (strain ATCC 51521 / SW) TaxID=414684 RepID=B6ISV8_RHOCS|nr:hypothetical protein [Rhodospirillum centenum]ACI98629.1 hypothetical protein RC1_1217 [Rhodospirillum centenum SW]
MGDPLVDRELTVEEMLSDPIVRALMRRDGVHDDDVRRTLARVGGSRRGGGALGGE